MMVQSRSVLKPRVSSCTRGIGAGQRPALSVARHGIWRRRATPACCCSAVERCGLWAGRHLVLDGPPERLGEVDVVVWAVRVVLAGARVDDLRRFLSSAARARRTLFSRGDCVAARWELERAAGEGKERTPRCAASLETAAAPVSFR
jgi:hypothetical protein